MLARNSGILAFHSHDSLSSRLPVSSPEAEINRHIRRVWRRIRLQQLVRPTMPPLRVQALDRVPFHPTFELCLVSECSAVASRNYTRGPYDFGPVGLLAISTTNRYMSSSASILPQSKLM